MTVYRVRVDGKSVWKHETAHYEGKDVFPAEYRAQPESGEVQLIVDDVVIAVNTPWDPVAEAQAYVAQRDAQKAAAAAKDGE